MRYAGAILRRWQSVDVLPGGFVILLTNNPADSVLARVHGFQLKDTLLILGPGPTLEFGMLFRNALDGTVIENVLAHGVGVFNIEKSRIRADLSEFFSASGKPRSGMGHAKGYGMGDGYGGENANPPNAAGRWPTNMAFIHDVGCRIVGSRKVSTGVAHRTRSGGKTFGGTADKPPMEDMTYGDQNGNETIPSYACQPNCLVRILDGQSGERPSTLTGRANPGLAHEHPSSATTDSWFSGGSAKGSQVYADSGSASRFFPQFKDRKDFLQWLHVLIAREGEVFSN